MYTNGIIIIIFIIVSLFNNPVSKIDTTFSIGIIYTFLNYNFTVFL